MENANKQASALILAAGKSERMNRHKFMLGFGNGKVFLEQLAAVYAGFGCREIVMVLNPEGMELCQKSGLALPPQAALVVNKSPELGRLGSIKAGMAAFSKPLPVFIQNVDSPFVNEELLAALLNGFDGCDYLLPRFGDKGGHPVLVSPQIARAVLIETDNDVPLKNFLKPYYGKTLEWPGHEIFININSPEDYEAYFGKG
jgi:molybdenum cofactor cytidylyltransferase